MTPNPLLNKEASSLDFDMMARMRILEGALGLPKWSVSGGDRRTIGKALRELPSQYPDLHPDWFIPREYGFEDAVLKGARLILRNEAGSATAEEIAQNLAAGLSPEGKETEDIYGEVGKKKAQDILAGRTGPKGLLNTLFTFAKNRAIDAFRKQRKQEEQRERISPSLVHGEEFGGFGDIDTLLKSSPSEVLQSLLSSPVANQFKNWLRTTVGARLNPTQRAILEAILEAGDEGITNKDIGSSHWVLDVKGSPISSQMVGKAREAIEDVITKEIKRNPRVLDWIDNYFDLAALGYGGGQQRLARRVAARYLMRRQGYGRVRQPGGLYMDFTGTRFTVQTAPLDPYGQVYDAAILLDQPRRPFKAALAVISQNWNVISHMKELWDVIRFVDDEAEKITGKSPRWHTYSMPD